MTEIKVKVTKSADRKALVAYYDDPVSGKRIKRSTGTERRKEAEKFAAKWEAELQEGRYKPASKVTWEEFRERLEKEYLEGKSDAYYGCMCSALNAFEAACRPEKLANVRDAQVRHFAQRLREQAESGRSKAQSTVLSYMKHLRAAMRWAVKQDMIAKLPKFEMPTVDEDEVAKGRPITAEEFDRLCAKIVDGLILAVSPRGAAKQASRRKFSAEALRKRREQQVAWAAEAADSWHYLLQGLWLSGLRLNEALQLTWDDDSQIRVDLDGRRPTISMPAAKNKRRKRIVCPITPDFAEFLLQTPENQRTGYVFAPRGKQGQVVRDRDWASRVIAAIGEAAGVKVKIDADTDEAMKFASAHDLRRSFGARWARRVVPSVLKELMRHKSIETTQKYYAIQDAEAIADVVWNWTQQNESVPSFVPSSGFSPPSERKEKAASP